MGPLACYDSRLVTNILAYFRGNENHLLKIFYMYSDSKGRRTMWELLQWSHFCSYNNTEQRTNTRHSVSTDYSEVMSVVTTMVCNGVVLSVINYLPAADVARVVTLLLQSYQQCRLIARLVNCVQQTMRSHNWTLAYYNKHSG